MNHGVTSQVIGYGEYNDQDYWMESFKAHFSDGLVTDIGHIYVIKESLEHFKIIYTWTKLKFKLL